MSYSSEQPLPLKDCSQNYGRLERINLATTSRIKKIDGLKNLLYKKDSANTTHLIIVWYQHSSGLTTPILEPPLEATKYTNSIWISNFINLMSSQKVQMELKRKFIPSPQRYNDHILMNEITKIISSTLVLKKINACRLYLQVIFVSKIIDIKGDKLLESALKEKQCKSNQLSAMNTTTTTK